MTPDELREALEIKKRVLELAGETNPLLDNERLLLKAAQAHLKLLEGIEGLRKPDSPSPNIMGERFNHPSTPSNEEYYFNLRYNQALDDVKKLMEGE